jgi:hypothetical protein
MSHALTAELARAFGLPSNVTRAVLTLEVNQPPRIDVTMLVKDAQGRFVLDRVADEVKRIDFSYRLVRIGER